MPDDAVEAMREVFANPLAMARAAKNSYMFVCALRWLREKANLSLQEVSHNAGQLGVAFLPKSTAHYITQLTADPARTRLPARAEQVRAFVLGCGRREAEAAMWVAEWTRLKNDEKRARQKTVPLPRPKRPKPTDGTGKVAKAKEIPGRPPAPPVPGPDSASVPQDAAMPDPGQAELVPVGGGPRQEEPEQTVSGMPQPRQSEDQDEKRDAVSGPKRKKGLIRRILEGLAGLVSRAVLLFVVCLGLIQAMTTIGVSAPEIVAHSIMPTGVSTAMFVSLLVSTTVTLQMKVTRRTGHATPDLPWLDSLRRRIVRTAREISPPADLE